MSSVIPQARKNFMAMAATVLPDDAYIWYGKRLSVFSAPITLQCYGWSALQEPAELTPQYRVEEHFDLACCLSSFLGDQDFDAREQEVMSLFALITTTLATDPNYRLGNTVRWAYITEYDFVPDVNGEQSGSVGILDFKVHGEQRIESLT